MPLDARSGCEELVLDQGARRGRRRSRAISSRRWTMSVRRGASGLVSLPLPDASGTSRAPRSTQPRGRRGLCLRWASPPRQTRVRRTGHHVSRSAELEHLADGRTGSARTLARLLRDERSRSDECTAGRRSVVAQAAEELQHEADVAILDRELRLVEQVDERVVALRPLEHPRHARLAKRVRTWVGLIDGS